MTWVLHSYLKGNTDWKMTLVHMGLMSDSHRILFCFGQFLQRGFNRFQHKKGQLAF